VAAGGRRHAHELHSLTGEFHEPEPLTVWPMRAARPAKLILFGEQYRGDLRSRDPGAQGRLAEVPEGGIVALLGANGAGKTTTLKAISNLLKAERGEVTKGSIEFKGERVDRR
jgi:ABC-type multidrug transport system fused ATPase/permease subunit